MRMLNFVSITIIIIIGFVFLLNGYIEKDENSDSIEKKKTNFNLQKDKFTFEITKRSVTAGRTEPELYTIPYDNNIYFSGNVLTSTRCSEIIANSSILNNTTILLNLEIKNKICTEDPNFMNKITTTWFKGEFHNFSEGFYELKLIVNDEVKIIRKLRVPGLNPKIECIEDSECVGYPSCHPGTCVNQSYAFKNPYVGGCTDVCTPCPICKCIQNSCVSIGSDFRGCC